MVSCNVVVDVYMARKSVAVVIAIESYPTVVNVVSFPKDVNFVQTLDFSIVLFVPHVVRLPYRYVSVLWWFPRTPKMKEVLMRHR